MFYKYSEVEVFRLVVMLELFNFQSTTLSALESNTLIEHSGLQFDNLIEVILYS